MFRRKLENNNLGLVSIMVALVWVASSLSTPSRAQSSKAEQGQTRPSGNQSGNQSGKQSANQSNTLFSDQFVNQFASQAAIKAMNHSASQAAIKAINQSANYSGKQAATLSNTKSPSLSPNLSGKVVKGFVVRQTSNNQGAITVYLCPRRWVLKTALISVIVDEDKDRVIAYTKQTNKYLLDSVEVGTKRFRGFRRVGDFAWGPYTTIGHEKYLGELVTVLERKGKRIDMRAKNDVVVIERELACPKVKLSKTFQEIADCMFALDFSQGMPLKVSRMARSSNPRLCTTHPVVVLESAALRESAIALSEFEIPSGLTRVKTEVDLFNDDVESVESIPGQTSNVIVRARQRLIHQAPQN